MIKCKVPMSYGIGNKTISYEGRGPFRITDEQFKKKLLGVGVFKENKDGTLYYAMPLKFQTTDGKWHDVHADGYLDLELTDLIEAHRGHFI